MKDPHRVFIYYSQSVSSAWMDAWMDGWMHSFPPILPYYHIILYNIKYSDNGFLI